MNCAIVRTNTNSKKNCLKRLRKGIDKSSSDKCGIRAKQDNELECSSGKKCDDFDLKAA